MDRYGVLVFPDQRISDEEQLAFTRNFGEIELAYGNRSSSINLQSEIQRSEID